MIVAIDCGSTAYAKANREFFPELKKQNIEICLVDELAPNSIEFIDEHDTVVAAFMLRGDKLVRGD